MMYVGIFNSGGNQFATAKQGDVGHDLTIDVSRVQTLFDRFMSWLLGRECIMVAPIIGQRVLPTGIHLFMPDDIWCEVRARSSAARKRLVILSGTIDSRYRGELYVVVHNLGLRPRILSTGERYAQVIFFPAVRPSMMEMSEQHYRRALASDVNNGERGATGFGSTGQ